MCIVHLYFSGGGLQTHGWPWIDRHKRKYQHHQFSTPYRQQQPKNFNLRLTLGIQALHFKKKQIPCLLTNPTFISYCNNYPLHGYYMEMDLSSFNSEPWVVCSIRTRCPKRMTRLCGPICLRLLIRLPLREFAGSIYV